MDCGLYLYKKYTLRDGIKIRRLIDYSMKKYPDITVDQCLEKIKQKKSYPHHHWFLILLFKHKYDKPYLIPEVPTEITLNEYSGKFYSRKKDFRKSGKFNEIDFILYLGSVQMLDSGFLSLEETQYHVVLDFLTLSISMVDIETQMSEYSEITIPDKMIDPPGIQQEDDQDKKDLFQQMIHGKISDTTLQCNDGEVYVSRLILSLHSPYFKRYFLFGNRNEKTENRFDYSVKDMKNYLFYCFFKKLERENIYPELIPMGKYLLDDSFVKYIHTEMIIKIDEDETLDQKEKLDLYKNLLTYLS
jgi:hypothetical protein